MERVEDMPLDEGEMNSLSSWADSHNFEEIALGLQASKYISKFLEIKSLESSSRMCYRSGKDRFTRKDGMPVTEEDIRAVDMRRMGQGHHVKGSPGDMEIIHDWFVDSSD